MHVPKGWEPGPDFQSAASLLAGRRTSVLRMLLLTIAVAVMTTAALVAAAELGWLPEVIDDASQGGSAL